MPEVTRWTSATQVVAVLAAGLLLAGGTVSAQEQSEGIGALDTVEAGFAIKELLLVAGEKAVESGAAADGFNGNPEIRVPLPAGLQTGEETLRRFGLSQEVDAVLLQLNRTAEHTAGQALPSFLEAIRETELADTLALLEAQDSAATHSFRAAREQDLVEALTPLASASLEQTGGIAAFRGLVEAGGSLVSQAGVVEDDLAPHVAGRTVHGLLQLMAAQELAIRHDPSARTTPLLRKAFGSPAAAATPADTAEAAVVESEVPDPAAEQTTSAKDEWRQGLTEALLVAGMRAVGRASQEDGYWGNEKIRIPLPEKLQKAGDRLRDVGLGSLVDELELSINRAAEQAAGEATSIIGDAVRSTTFEDVLTILTGGETAATDALRAKTEDRLTEALLPVIDAKMQSTGVSRHYDRLVERAGPVLLLLGLDAEADLPTYVTAQALDGLFTLLAEEEAKIRKDPVARTTELLRRIFGSSG